MEKRVFLPLLSASIIAKPSFTSCSGSFRSYSHGTGLNSATEGLDEFFEPLAAHVTTLTMSLLAVSREPQPYFSLTTHLGSISELLGCLLVRSLGPRQADQFRSFDCSRCDSVFFLNSPLCALHCDSYCSEGGLRG